LAPHRYPLLPEKNPVMWAVPRNRKKGRVMRKDSSVYIRLLCGTAIAFAGVFGAGSGSAQEEVATNDGEAIVVTGSRIRANGFNSPQPLTVIGAEQIENMVQTSSQDILKSIPQITSV